MLILFNIISLSHLFSSVEECDDRIQFISDSKYYPICLRIWLSHPSWRNESNKQTMSSSYWLARNKERTDNRLRAMAMIDRCSDRFERVYRTSSEIEFVNIDLVDSFARHRLDRSRVVVIVIFIGNTSENAEHVAERTDTCLLYTSPSPRD